MSLLSRIAGAAMLAATLVAGPVQAQEASVIDQVIERGTLRVGLDSFVPWAFRDKNGELIGFEVDVATRLAADLGVELELVPTAWDGIIPALLAGNFDVIIGGLSIRTDRNLRVNFTVPYAASGLLLAANAETNPGLTSLDDFNVAGITITAKRGTTIPDFVQQRLPNATLREFDDEAAAFQEVRNGNAAAFIASIPAPGQEVARSGGLLYLPVTEPFESNVEAFAVRKGDVDTLNVFNNWILLRTNDGWLKERHDYWFNSIDWQDQLPQ